MLLKVALLVVFAVVILVLAFKVLDGTLRIVVPALILVLLGGAFFNVLQDRPLLSIEGFSVVSVERFIPEREDIGGLVNATVSNVSRTIGEIVGNELAEGVD